MTVGVMYATWYERKIVARMQMRLGPTRTGPFGLLQPIADTFKLLTKEDLRPATADVVAFELAVFAIFVPAFMVFVAVPFTADWFVSAAAAEPALHPRGLGPVVHRLPAWPAGARDNKYALLGGMRAAAQLISYEIPLILALVAVVMVTASLDVYQIILYQDDVPLIVCSRSLPHLPHRVDRGGRAAAVRHPDRRVRGRRRRLHRVQRHPLVDVPADVVREHVRVRAARRVRVPRRLGVAVRHRPRAGATSSC